MKRSMLAVAVVVSLLLSGCNSEVAGPVGSSTLNTPHAGTWTESDAGAVVHAWGLTETSIMLYSDGPRISFVFDVSEPSHTWLWIVGTDEFDDSLVRAGGATFVTPAAHPVRTLMEGRLLQAGAHEVSWDLSDDSREPVPDGIYRFYVQVGELREWHDMLVVPYWQYWQTY